MAKKISYFKCFSINLHRWLKVNSQRFIKKGQHENGKTFWIYEFDEAGELSQLLTEWSDNKREKEGK